MSEPRNIVSIFMHLSRVGEKIYVALDASPTQLEDFGISMEEFHEMSDAIEDAVKFVIEPLDEERSVKSML